MISSPPQIVDVAQDLARQIGDRATAADRAGKLPAEDVQALQESGYLSMVVPLEYGGLGLGMRDTLDAHITLGQGSTSTALVAAMTLQVLASEGEFRQWRGDHYEKLCRLVAQDGAIINAVASEPKMGSPSRGKAFATTAQRNADGNWVIHGHKNWITGGQHLTHMVVKLMLEDTAGALLVANHLPGLRWDETWGDALSLRASDSHDLYFEDVVVSAENVLLDGSEGKAPYSNAWFPMLMGATYLGGAIGARNAVIQYALERVPTALGKPIATLPKIQRQIGEMDIALQAAQALMLAVAHQWDAHPDDRAMLYPRIAAAKHHAVETAISVTDIALKIAGGQAIMPSLPLERFFRDVRAGSMQPPSGDTALEIVGRGAVAERETTP